MGKPTSGVNASDFETSFRLGAEAWAGSQGASYGAQYTNNVEQAIRQATDALRQMGDSTGNKGLDYAKGDIAEIWHAETFNIDASRLGKTNVSARAPRDTGAADIRFGSSPDLKDAQLKYYKNGEETAKAISNPKYGQMEKVVPSDQLEEVKRTAETLKQKNELRRPEQAKQYEHTAKSASDRLKEGGVESKPLSEAEAKQMAKELRDGTFDPKKYGLHIDSVVKWSDIARQSGQAAVHAALFSLALKSAPLMMDMLKKAMQESAVDPGEFLLKGIDAFHDAVWDGLRGGIASFLTISCQSGQIGSMFKQASPDIIGAATVVAVNAIRNAIKLSRGQLTASEFADACLMDSIVVSFGLLGAAAGQALIPIPLLGSLIGNLIGGLIGTLVYQGSKSLIMTLAIDRGWTLFGFVDQNYTVPREMLARTGIHLIKLSSIQLNPLQLSTIQLHRLSVGRIQIEPLSRGLLRANMVGYI
ncbi:hypothetical protein PAESOLCIP111_01701 [Paenibacillus solanacearum]|uniref:Uncharacterized protein n=1 Tax=Paenibacillus solanacearum TaxID=2048548 RepID=A0A916K1B4_9BACL|nr:hypothetical protein [Paenibacillus solanacearum]CAG7614362.1 hypothetical protein PAESOLCIP111_01701 [Paenibacillus solanacearum]